MKLGGEKGHLTRDDLRSCGLESNPLGDRLIGTRSCSVSVRRSLSKELDETRLLINPQTSIKDMFIPPVDESDMNMNTDTCSFHQFCMVLAHFQPSTNKTQDTDINSRQEIAYGHLRSLKSLNLTCSIIYNAKLMSQKQ